MSATTSRVVRLVLVDDHALVRQGLRSVLEREPDLQVVGEAGSPDDAVATVAQCDPDVVLLDLMLSEHDDAEGLSVCQRLTAGGAGPAVLVVSSAWSDGLVLRAVRAGAQGYVVKDVDTTVLLQAIRDVAGGGSAFDARSAAAMVRAVTTPGPTGSPGLTDRELEVLGLLAHGSSNKDIGRRLYISQTTAKFHVGNILRKLEVTSRAEAVYAATQRGLL